VEADGDAEASCDEGDAEVEACEGVEGEEREVEWGAGGGEVVVEGEGERGGAECDGGGGFGVESEDVGEEEVDEGDAGESEDEFFVDAGACGADDVACEWEPGGFGGGGELWRGGGEWLEGGGDGRALGWCGDAGEEAVNELSEDEEGQGPGEAFEGHEGEDAESDEEGVSSDEVLNGEDGECEEWCECEPRGAEELEDECEESSCADVFDGGAVGGGEEDEQAEFVEEEDGDEEEEDVARRHGEREVRAFALGRRSAGGGSIVSPRFSVGHVITVAERGLGEAVGRGGRVRKTKPPRVKAGRDWRARAGCFAGRWVGGRERRSAGVLAHGFELGGHACFAASGVVFVDGAFGGGFVEDGDRLFEGRLGFLVGAVDEAVVELFERGAHGAEAPAVA